MKISQTSFQKMVAKAIGSVFYDSDVVRRLEKIGVKVCYPALRKKARK